MSPDYVGALSFFENLNFHDAGCRVLDGGKTLLIRCSRHSGCRMPGCWGSNSLIIFIDPVIQDAGCRAFEIRSLFIFCKLLYFGILRRSPSDRMQGCIIFAKALIHDFSPCGGRSREAHVLPYLFCCLSLYATMD